MSSFSHAGVSKQDGKFKVRFANDALRTKVLIKNGHTDIDIIELKHPMTKSEAVAYLLSIDFDNGNKAVREALEAAQEKRTEAPKAVAKVAKVAKVPAKKTSKPSMDAIKAKAAVAVKAKAKAKAKVDTSAMEDAPF
jgi:diphthamide biosynthesis methyltransferase